MPGFFLCLLVGFRDKYEGIGYPLAQHMLVLGHRGVLGRTHSENTLEAFQEAIRQGADGVEFDLRVARDGELVVFHDPTLNRIAGDAHHVSELTSSELARVSLRNGGTIPTLQDVTSHIHAPHLLDIEVKHRDAVEPLMTKLKTSAGLRERVIVSSFHSSVIVRIRREFSDVRVLLLVSRWPLPLRGRRFWTRLERVRPWGVAFPIQLLNKQRVAVLRKHGVHVGAWDVRRTIGEVQKARHLGVDVAIVQHVKEAKIPHMSA